MTHHQRYFQNFTLICIFTSFLFIISQARAATLSAQDQSALFEAFEDIERNRWAKARDKIAATKNPLAAKIYHWMLYTHHPDKDRFIGLTAFIRQNPDWPAIYRLRQKAEENLPRDLPNRDIIAWFDDYPPLTAQGLDIYLGALITTGQTAKAQDILTTWWGKTLTGRDEQKYLFGKYNRYITKEAHLKRMDTMLYERHYTNARAVARVLGGGYPALAEARIALAENKGNVNALINRVPKNLLDDAGLVFERLRWRRKRDLDSGAIELLNQAGRLQGIHNQADWWRERHIMVRRLIEDRKYNQAYALASTHIQTDGFPYAQGEWVSGFLALRLVNKPREAYQHFQNLYNNVSTPISKSRGAYWSGRAAAALGKDHEASKWYQEAANYQTTYYGQMAISELALKGDLRSLAPPVLNATQEATFAVEEMIQTAMIFEKAGLKDESADFLFAFIDSKKTPEAYRYAADLALSWGRTDDAVRIAKDATAEGHFLTAQSFPVIAEHLKHIDVEWALVHALIRQESLFDQNARSSAGALGLMQLMPATAKETARSLRILHSTSWLTDRPAHNIQLGTTYLARLLRQFDGAYPLAIAAYNAGPNRVKRWVKEYGDPRKGEIDIIDWIELIPIYETRNYVQRVIENTYIYRLRLKNIQKPPSVAISMATPQNLQNL